MAWVAIRRSEHTDQDGISHRIQQRKGREEEGTGRSGAGRVSAQQAASVVHSCMLSLTSTLLAKCSSAAVTLSTENKSPSSP